MDIWEYAEIHHTYLDCQVVFYENKPGYAGRVLEAQSYRVGLAIVGAEGWEGYGVLDLHSKFIVYLKRKVHVGEVDI